MFSRKDLIRLLGPLIIEQLLAVTIGMADTVMVASVGETAVSGVSLVDTISLLLINLFSALATGGAVVAAQYLGRGERHNACTAAKQLLYAITGLSALIMGICLIWRNQILSLVFGNVEPLVMQNAQIYFLLTTCSYPLLAVYNAGAALFRSMGNSKVSMFTSLLMNITNVSVNAILIFGGRMGVAGAGIGTLVARGVGAVIMFILVQNRRNTIHIEQIWKPELHFGMIKNILRVGIPNGLENGMFHIGKILLQGLITSFGTVAITANAVGNTISTIAQIPGTAVGLGLITVVGQCVGAGLYDQARKYVVKLMKIAYISMGALNLLVILLLNPIIGAFFLSPQTAQLASELMLYQCICCILIWPASFVLPNALRAAGDVKYTMLISVLSMWIFRILLSYLITAWLNIGVMGVWIAMTIDWVVRSMAFILRMVSGKWQTKKLLD